MAESPCTNQNWWCIEDPQEVICLHYPIRRGRYSQCNARVIWTMEGLIFQTHHKTIHYIPPHNQKLFPSLRIWALKWMGESTCKVQCITFNQNPYLWCLNTPSNRHDPPIIDSLNSIHVFHRNNAKAAYTILYQLVCRRYLNEKLISDSMFMAPYSRAHSFLNKAWFVTRKRGEIYGSPFSRVICSCTVQCLQPQHHVPFTKYCLLIVYRLVSICIRPITISSTRFIHISSLHYMYVNSFNIMEKHTHFL